MEMVDITIYIKLVFAIVTILLTGFLIPYLKQKYGLEKFNKWYEIICIAVAAAEQIYKVGEGDKKKAFVLEYLQSTGITFDEQTIDVLIESAVRELKENALSV